VTDFDSLFCGIACTSGSWCSQCNENCANFNADINSWDTSRVTNFHLLFYSAVEYNQPLDKWNTSRALDMRDVFQKASSFNQPIGNWNTKQANHMAGIFYEAAAFNQPLNWDVSNVGSFAAAFQGATSLSDCNKAVINAAFSVSPSWDSLHGPAFPRALFKQVVPSCN